MRFPWQIRRADAPEKRADSSYTDVLVASLVGQATAGKSADIYGTAALEACAGLVGRAFAVCEVDASEGVKAALTPAWLELCGRSLIRRGELVAYIAVDEDGLSLTPASSHDVDGSFDPRTWRYRLNLAGPSRMHTRSRVPASSVFHCMYSRTVERPWYGIGPIQSAALASKLSAETVKALGDEVSGPVGALLQTPVDGNDPTVSALKKDLRVISGSTLLVQSGDWGSAGSPQGKTWENTRLGSAPPVSLIEQAKLASMEIYAACGMSPALWQDADGTAAREAWRQVLFGTIAPLANLIATELSKKLEQKVKLSFEELRSSDIAGRARAFGILVKGGMALEKAASISGVISQDESD